MIKSKISETEIQTMILDFLNKKGIFCFRVNTTGIYDPTTQTYRRPGKFSLKGTSDILGILPDGRFLAIEVKTKSGKVSLEQSAFIDKINIKNGKAFVARSVQDVEDNLRIYL